MAKTPVRAMSDREPARAALAAGVLSALLLVVLAPVVAGQGPASGAAWCMGVALSRVGNASAAVSMTSGVRADAAGDRAEPSRCARATGEKADVRREGAWSPLGQRPPPAL